MLRSWFDPWERRIVSAAKERVAMQLRGVENEVILLGVDTLIVPRAG